MKAQKPESIAISIQMTIKNPMGHQVTLLGKSDIFGFMHYSTPGYALSNLQIRGGELPTHIRPYITVRELVEHIEFIINQHSVYTVAGVSIGRAVEVPVTYWKQ